MQDKSKLHINYLYFGLYFVICYIFSFFSVYQIKNTSNYTSSFFMIYSFGQLAIEVVGFALLSLLIKKYFHKSIFNLFIGLTFLMFLSHIVDFFLLRILDMTIWDGIELALDENLENFFEMLHCTGISYKIWALLGLIILTLPFIGVFVYKLLYKVISKNSFVLHHEHLLQVLFSIPLTLFIWDFRVSSTINPDIYASYQRLLPWKLTFVQPKTMTIDTIVKLKKPRDEKETISLIDQKNLNPKNTPNIYLFIIESLREDFISQEITPTIERFKSENINFETSFANANGTHQSWFSIFYSSFPYNWKYGLENNWEKGSIALNILKKIGYKINVYSAPELKYYNMKEILFGKDLHLADKFKLFPHYPPVEACDADKQAIDELKNDIKENEKNINIIFFDSTHFIYSWPKNQPLKFYPISEEISYLTTYPSKYEIEFIKNRYKNAVYYIDTLIDDFISYLKKNNLYNNSIIIITGDHGEEFYEEGHLYHGSHLSKMQTTVPIYYKLGDNQREVNKAKKLTCHMDIFPSIFDYIFGENLFKDVLDGDSIFDYPKWPFVVTTRYNASRYPWEFFIHNGNEKMILRFKNKNNIYAPQHIQIISLQDNEDNLHSIPTQIEKNKYLILFQKAFDRIFE